MPAAKKLARRAAKAPASKPAATAEPAAKPAAKTAKANDFRVVVGDGVVDLVTAHGTVPLTSEGLLRLQREARAAGGFV